MKFLKIEDRILKMSDIKYISIKENEKCCLYMEYWILPLNVSYEHFLDYIEADYIDISSIVEWRERDN